MGLLDNDDWTSPPQPAPAPRKTPRRPRPPRPVRDVAPIEVPALADVDPEYGKLAIKLAELQSRRKEVDDSIQQKLNARRDPERKSALSAAVLELVGDLPQGVTAAQAMADAKRLNDIQSLIKERSDLDVAINVVRVRRDSKSGPASKAACDAVRPYRDALAGRMTDLLIQLHAVSSEYRLFCDELDAKGISWTGNLEPMKLTHLMGDPFDWQSSGAYYLKEAFEQGIIGLDEIPEPWRKLIPPQ